MIRQIFAEIRQFMNKREETEKEKRKYEQVWKNDEYRHVSPGLMALEKYDLIKMLRAHGVRTVLDAGCGSGKLMRRLIEECGDEFEVYGFDLAENCLDSFFNETRDKVLTVGCLWNENDMLRKYDAVICTDVLEHIPTAKIPDVLRNLKNSAEKFSFLGIALFPDFFGNKLIGEPLHLTVMPPKWWLKQLDAAGFKDLSYFTERVADTGQDVWLFVYNQSCKDADSGTSE